MMNNETSPSDAQQSQQKQDLLGLSTNEFAGLSVEDVIENKTAMIMLMHYYKKLVDDNNALRNEANTLKTYVDGYQR